ncbi:hypothetical protein H9Y05_07335 [Crocinitomicaceae bacterium CZZ-1]|uniref:Lipoprotein n=1 Tax=Taishania pollutisoli TaxID=2766479 RepID=A0A8J6TSJ5_9FLAO|nr:hypothetical protein [Taishania pollutisoli]MBC9812292.1 hypothetical protein [Taishania pollutisoli]NGF74278.1 hypothetical protein [Fluviicola sp. SGL-29]
MKQVYFILLLLILTACSGGLNNHNKGNDHQNLEPNVLNLSAMYSDGEKIISFPVWFNDSIIKRRGIRAIERTFYYETADSTEDGAAVTPDKKITYSFTKDGLLQTMQIGNYYDNRLISTILISYSDHQEVTGFAKVKLNEEIRKEDFAYYEFKQLQRTKSLVSFESTASSRKLFVVPNSKNWKSLTIDTLCRPGKDDIIAWGSMRHPEKIYSVQNLVEESNVREFTYVEGVLKHIDWTDDPFKIHRTFRFDKEGICTGFVDSTFSMGDFVASSNYDFELKNGLPVNVVKEVKRGEIERVIFKETFEYIYDAKKAGD